jgi:quercetin dioxygenase-like cupin family protein
MTDRRLSIRPDEIVWKPQGALPVGAEVAPLLGETSSAGSYVFRLRVPPGHTVESHYHPDERTYTVLSGTLSLGFGHRYEEQRLDRYPEGSVVIVRAERRHFQWGGANGYTVQIEGTGPTAVTYSDPRNDPRRGKGPDAPLT